MNILTVVAAVLATTVGIVDCQSCPTGWVRFMDSCYVFINERVPWTSAKVFCDVLDANMLEVQTQQENDFIVGHIRNISGVRSAWMGMNDIVREGRWVFVSDRQMPVYTNWAPNQPDDSHGHENGEDCVEMWGDGTWNDLWCYERDAHITYPSPVCETEANDELIG